MYKAKTSAKIKLKAIGGIEVFIWVLLRNLRKRLF